ncbi:MAG: mandelate racemase/muconate lactonizing protein [Chloroflexi bacterium]|nr:mandelate racemase/muconate lactonizing protein [Chloroflexota bacterium]|tara:strand:+ start:362 stop:1549 length:1188 start_codon:yes stop_codon:yes gene_type:complete
MKITKIIIRKLFGTINFDGQFWEERLVRPIDIYPEYEIEQRETNKKGKFLTESIFIEIYTDNDLSGIAGPIDEQQAFIIEKNLSEIILGKDPLAIELLWDQMHRLSVHGRQGITMQAISAIDCALWDIKGKYFNTPIYNLIGGPTRNSIPAYASMLGFSVTDMSLVAERALAYKAKGFDAQKWFFRYGPMSGKEGLKKNIELVETLRNTLGEDYDIMLDCWQSMDYQYVLELARNIEPFRPFWLEEVVMPDRIDIYKKIKEKINIPLSGAEHEYTRWGMFRFLEKKALDILQPDIYWAGGLSEVMKIANLASTYDLIIIPHGHSSNATLHFSLSQIPIHTPYQEFLIKWNIVHQHFLKYPEIPVQGQFRIPTRNGLSMELDQEKVEKEDKVVINN